jgi:hypothetical protein
MGYREVRLINKGASRHLICFVDFATPAHAFLAMRTLQGQYNIIHIYIVPSFLAVSVMLLSNLRNSPLLEEI